MVRRTYVGGELGGPMSSKARSPSHLGVRSLEFRALALMRDLGVLGGFGACVLCIMFLLLRQTALRKGLRASGLRLYWPHQMHLRGGARRVDIADSVAVLHCQGLVLEVRAKSHEVNCTITNNSPERHRCHHDRYQHQACFFMLWS